MQLLQHFKELTIRPKNAKELKGLILKLAVQGKLTYNWREENPNIESAKVLINNILKDKKRMTKQKKELSLVTKEEKLFKLPESWVWCRLGDITDLPYGKGLSKKDLTVEGYNVFGANGLIGRYSSYLYEDEQLLISCRGAYSGKTNISPKKCFVTSNSLVCEFFNKELTYYKYFFYSITALPKDEIISGSAQPQVTATNALPLPIPLPPLEEQKEIVKVVEILFKEVEQLEQLTVARIGLKEDFVRASLKELTNNNTKKEWAYLQEHFKNFFNETKNIKKLRETVLQLAVQGKLTADWRQQRSLSGAEVEDARILLKRIQEEKAQLIKDKKIKKEKALPVISKEEIPYELPDGWIWCRLGDVIKEKPKNGFSPRGVEFETKTKSLKLGATTRGVFDSSQVKYLNEVIPIDSYLWLQKNDILIQRSNSLDYVGVSAIYKGKNLEFIYPDLMMKIQSCQSIGTEYLYTILSNKFVRQYFRDNASGTSSNMPKINQGIVLNTMIPLCNQAEQKAIVQKVNALMALCDSLEKEVEQSQEQNELLMQSCLREVFEFDNIN